MCVYACVCVILRRSFLSLRAAIDDPLPFFFLPHFPLDSPLQTPFPHHPTPPPPPFIFFVCSLFSLYFLPFLGFSPPSSDLSHSPTVHTRAVGGTLRRPQPPKNWRMQTIVSTTTRLDVFFRLFAVKQLYYIYTLIEFQS